MAASTALAAPFISTKTSSALWGAFHELPTCPGKDDSDHRLFLVTNELNHAKTLKLLNKEPQTGNLILSNSGLMTLNVFAVREKTENMHVLVIDCSLRVQRFWMTFQSIMAREHDRTEVTRAIMQELSENTEFYYRSDMFSREMSDVYFGENLKLFVSEIEQKIGWLSTRDGYQRVVKLFQEGRFHFQLGDWSSSKLIDGVLNAMTRTGFRLDTLVQNNIFEYCEDEDPAVFHKYRLGLDRLMNPSTWIVKTIPRCACGEDPLKQHAILRAEEPIEKVMPFSISCDHFSGFSGMDRAAFTAAYTLHSMREMMRSRACDTSLSSMTEEVSMEARV